MALVWRKSVPLYNSRDPRPLGPPGTQSTPGSRHLLVIGKRKYQPTFRQAINLNHLTSAWTLITSSSIPWQLSQLWRRLKTTTLWSLSLTWKPTNIRSSLLSRSCMTSRSARSIHWSGKLSSYLYYCKICDINLMKEPDPIPETIDETHVAVHTLTITSWKFGFFYVY